MKVRRYQTSDYESVKFWMFSRGSELPPPSQLPKTGWIVDDVATIFLMKPDCSIGILEYFITNQEAPKEERLKACDMLISEAFQEAKKCGLEVVTGSTSIAKVMALGLRYGFKTDAKSYYFFRINLEELDERRNWSGRSNVDGNGAGSRIDLTTDDLGRQA